MLAVPVDHALAYTAERGWHVLTAPPAWWLEQHEELLEQDALRDAVSRAERKRENARRAAAARWAKVADRVAATEAMRTAQRSKPAAERSAQARRAGVASGAARRRAS